MFSVTVCDGTSVKCWWTMPMPASIASRGDRNDDRPAVDADLALVRPVEAGEDVHERALAGAVLAEQRVDLARPQVEVDVVVGEDAREALDDPGRLERGRASSRGRPRRGRSRISAVGEPRSSGLRLASSAGSQA